jgi:hypothetical protein
VTHIDKGNTSRRNAGSGLLDRAVGLLAPAAALRRAIALTDRGEVARAFRLFARAARAGIAEAEYRVGRSYLEGSVVPVSRADGARWLERAAIQGHVDAQWLLGVLYAHGVGTPANRQQIQCGGAAPSLFSAGEAPQPDFVAAEKWARRAAEHGSADGQALLAYILSCGPESMRNPEEAHRWYERSAQADCPQGALGYALSLMRLVKCEEDKLNVAVHLRRAAQAGLAPAIHLLGVLTERGAGIERDQAAAAQLYRQAAAKGNRSGQASWGRALMWGLGVEPNPAEGESWLRRAALAGDPDAAALVGDLYVKGGALPPNYAEAAIWFRRAAETGHCTAARALGLLYLSGAGVARDPKEAAHWLRISAEAGDPHARVDLAILLLKGVGDGRPEDLAKARRWLEQAAESGNLVAAFNYGLCLLEGAGLERDERKAAQWLRRAADGVVDAQYWYGRMLAEGRGVEADAEAGRAWIARAAALGMADAEAALAEMMVNGRGGPRDQSTATALFEKAARKGHIGAMFALGALARNQAEWTPISRPDCAANNNFKARSEAKPASAFADSAPSSAGSDLLMDRAVAQRWLEAAADRGHPEACKLLSSAFQLDQRASSGMPTRIGIIPPG